MEKFLCFIIITLCATGTLAQVPRLGRCPDTSVVTNFNAARYLGQWFEIRSFPAFFQIGASCTEANYALNPNLTIAILNRAVRLNRPFQIQGEATVPVPGQGKLIVNFPGQPVATEANYFVLGTDYDNFAVVHSCNQINRFVHTQLSWVLSRRRTLGPLSTLRVQNILNANGIDQEIYRDTRQINCPSFN